MEEPIYCPFCGNEHAEALEEPGGTYGVYCGFCNANLTGYTSKAAAVKQWNHRYAPAKETADE